MEKQETNIDKMTEFIKHEASQKIKELTIKSEEEYNTEKAKIVKQETEKIEKDYLKKLKEEEIRFTCKISEIKNKYSMAYLNFKDQLINEILEEVKIKLKTQKTTKEMVDEAIEKFDEDVIVYCNDTELVKRKNLKVKPLDDSFIGGIIVENLSGNIRCDNSFLERMVVFKERNLNFLSKKLFNEK